MIVFLLVFLHLYTWSRYKSQSRFLILMTSIFLFISLFSLTFLQMEVSDLNLRGTYGSDETNYYEWMLLIKSGLADAREFPAPLFNFIGSIILKTSFFDSVVLIRIFNVLVFSFSLNLLCIVLSKRYKNVLNIKTFKGIYIFLSINGIVIWTTIRTLKDILFISLIIIFIYSFDEIIMIKNKMAKFCFLFFLCLLSFIAFQNIRPFGGILILLIILIKLLMKYSEMNRKLLKPSNFRKKWLVLPLLIIFVFIIFKFVNFGMLRSFRDLIYTPLGFQSNIYLTTTLEFLRFILGPGPINSIRQVVFGDVFVVSTRFADFLILFGAVQWWLLLGVFVVKSLFYPKLTLHCIKVSLDFFSIAIFIISTYTFVYGGTGDTRLRAIMYIALYGVIIPFMSYKIRLKKT